jgi:transposase
MPMIGIDISKAKLDAALALPGGSLRTKVFRNDTAGFTALLQWGCRLLECTESQLHLAMEATGAYHEPLARHAHAQGAKVSLINPAQARAYAEAMGTRHKTDRQDSKVLLAFACARALPLWQPLPQELSHLRSLVQHWSVLSAELQAQLNRLEPLRLNGAAPAVMASVHALIAHLQAQCHDIEQAIADHIERHPTLKADQELLQTIPGIGQKSALRLMLHLRTHAFQSASQCAALAGLVPVLHESGSSVRKLPRLAKNGAGALRRTLYMAAITAKRSNPDARALYERLLRRGKARMSALGAVMRKLIHIAFGVLKHQMPYQPQGVPS